MKPAASVRSRMVLESRVAHSAFKCDGPEEQVTAQFEKWIDLVKYALSAEREDLPAKTMWPVSTFTDGEPGPRVDHIIERQT